MQQISLKCKSQNANFGFNLVCSSPSSSNDQLPPKKHFPSPPMKASKTRKKELEVIKEESEVEEKEMPPPTRRQRRKAAGKKSIKKMQLHNRKDDVPDCDTLEIIEFEESEHACTPNAQVYPDSLLSGASSSSSYESFKSPLPEQPEVRISFTDATNTNNNNNNNVTPRRSFSYATSNAERYSSSAPSTTDSRNTSAMSSTTRRKHRRHKLRRSQKPSPLMKFAQSLLENLGHAVTDFFMFLCSLLKMNGSDSNNYHRMTPTGFVMLLVGIYFFISYIEVSFAGVMEMLFEWLWPCFHISLRMIERFFKGIGNAFAGLDDVAESSYCDMASMWCDYFNLMCSSRCSFTRFALERLRK